MTEISRATVSSSVIFGRGLGDGASFWTSGRFGCLASDVISGGNPENSAETSARTGTEHLDRKKRSYPTFLIEEKSTRAPAGAPRSVNGYILEKAAGRHLALEAGRITQKLDSVKGGFASSHENPHHCIA